MIKTDKVIYRTRTQREYNWLMEKLEEAGCRWYFGQKATDCDDTWEMYESETCIPVDNKELKYMSLIYYEEHLDEFKNYDYIEVSDLMENEMKTELLEKLETLNEHLEDELKKSKKGDNESQKIKKIVYTTEVYFE